MCSGRKNTCVLEWHNNIHLGVEVNYKTQWYLLQACAWRRSLEYEPFRFGLHDEKFEKSFETMVVSYCRSLQLENTAMRLSLARMTPDGSFSYTATPMYPFEGLDESRSEFLSSAVSWWPLPPPNKLLFVKDRRRRTRNSTLIPGASHKVITSSAL